MYIKFKNTKSNNQIILNLSIFIIILLYYYIFDTLRHLLN